MILWVNQDLDRSRPHLLQTQFHVRICLDWSWRWKDWESARLDSTCGQLLGGGLRGEPKLSGCIQGSSPTAFKKYFHSWVSGFVCCRGPDQPVRIRFLVLHCWGCLSHCIQVNGTGAGHWCCGYWLPFPVDVTWTLRSPVYICLSGRAVCWWTSLGRSTSEASRE